MVRISLGPKTRADSRVARRKREILQAASQEFRARGFHATGMRPECLPRLVAAGVHLPIDLFEPRQLELWRKEE